MIHFVMIHFLRARLSLSMILLFCLSSQAWANSVSQGQITVLAPFGSGGFSMSLSGPGVSLTQMFDDAIFADPGFQQCPLCTIAEISAMPVLRLSGPGDVLVNGQPSGWEGVLDFAATSFHSSLSSSGALTVNGSLSVSALVNLCNPPGEACIFTGVSFPVLDNGQWRYVAHFAPAPEAGEDGVYRFENLTITTVPEPATVVLLLTGLGALGSVRRLRRRFGDN